MSHGYAKDQAMQFLRSHAETLESLLPDTEATKRNLSNIKKHNPIDKMDFVDLCSFVDLLKRSIPE